jgi:hypothetical protein
MKNINNRLNLAITLFLTLLSFSVIAQQEQTVTTEECTDCSFQINRYKLDKDDLTLKVYINAKNDSGSPFDLNQLNLKIEEKKSNEGDEAYETYNYTKKEMAGSGAEAPTVLFLLDISGSMCGDKIINAKNAILDVISDNDLPQDRTYFATFHDEVSESKVLTRDNYDEVVAPVQACNAYDTDLHFALDEKVRELNKKRQVERLSFY